MIETKYALALVAALVAPARAEQDALDRDNIARAIEKRHRIPWYEKQGKVKHWHACRTAPGGCAVHVLAISGYIVEAARKNELDPYLLAAVAWKESRFVAYATGDVKERGVFQIHPKTRSNFEFLANPACEKKQGQCQQEVVDYGAQLLVRYSDRCGSLDGGLSAWNTGRCESETGAKYAASVRRTAKALRKEGEA